VMEMSANDTSGTWITFWMRPPVWAQEKRSAAAKTAAISKHLIFI
jgi:hypothetical protein